MARPSASGSTPRRRSSGSSRVEPGAQSSRSGPAECATSTAPFSSTSRSKTSHLAKTISSCGRVRPVTRSNRRPLRRTRSSAVRVAGATTPSVAMVPSKSHARTRNRTTPLCQSTAPGSRTGAQALAGNPSPERSVIEAHPDLGALADLGPDLDAALLQVGTLPHRDHAEVLAGVEAPLGGGDIEADAVVADDC